MRKLLALIALTMLLLSPAMAEQKTSVNAITDTAAFIQEVRGHQAEYCMQPRTGTIEGCLKDFDKVFPLYALHAAWMVLDLETPKGSKFKAMYAEERVRAMDVLKKHQVDLEKKYSPLPRVSEMKR